MACCMEWLHTDHSKFADLVPVQECIVGPVCEYHVQYKPGYGTFILQIPHIVENNKEAKEKLKIQIQERQDGTLQEALRAGQYPGNLATAA